MQHARLTQPGSANELQGLLWPRFRLRSIAAVPVFWPSAARQGSLRVGMRTLSERPVTPEAAQVLNGVRGGKVAIKRRLIFHYIKCARL